MIDVTDGDAKVGIEAAIDALRALADQTIEAARQGQVVETDLLTMRIGIIAEALRHADRAEATVWLPQLHALSTRLSDLAAVLDKQESRLKADMAARAQRALDAYR